MLKFIMLPHAGSICGAYSEWKAFSNHKVEVVSIDYNGRGKYSALPEPRSWKELIVSTAKHVLEHVEEYEEFVLFGHSMGAKVAIDIYFYLAENNYKLPQKLIFSSSKLFSEPQEHLHLMCTRRFEDYFIQLGGISDEVLAFVELKELLFYYLRLDTRLLSQFKARQPYKLVQPSIVILYGDQENGHPKVEWNELFRQACTYKVFPGDHFYLFEQKQDVFDFVLSTLPKHAHIPERTIAS